MVPRGKSGLPLCLPHLRKFKSAGRKSMAIVLYSLAFSTEVKEKAFIFQLFWQQGENSLFTKLNPQPS